MSVSEGFGVVTDRILPMAAENIRFHIGSFESVPDDQLLIIDRMVIEDREPRRCAEVTTFYTFLISPKPPWAPPC